MITQEEVARIALLSRLSFSDEALQALTAEMDELVTFAHTITEAAAAEQPFEGLYAPEDRLRDDTICPSWPQEAILSTVHGGENGYFPVKGRQES